MRAEEIMELGSPRRHPNKRRMMPEVASPPAKPGTSRPLPSPPKPLSEAARFSNSMHSRPSHARMRSLPTVPSTPALGGAAPGIGMPMPPHIHSGPRAVAEAPRSEHAPPAPDAAELRSWRMPRAPGTASNLQRSASERTPSRAPTDDALPALAPSVHTERSALPPRPPPRRPRVPAKDTAKAPPRSTDTPPVPPRSAERAASPAAPAAEVAAAPAAAAAPAPAPQNQKAPASAEGAGPGTQPGGPPIPILMVEGEPMADDFDTAAPKAPQPSPTSQVTVSVGGTDAAPSGPFHASSSGSGPPTTPVSEGIHSACAACGRWIGGRLVHAMNKAWHPACFLCSHCSTPLEHVSFYEHDGRPYCHLDFHELFSRRCYHCQTPIVDERFVTVDDHRLGGQRTYHELHFFCASCGEPFIDPKDGSREADLEARSGDDGGVRLSGRPFYVHGTHPYCETCHTRLHLPRCKACKEPILCDAIRAMNAAWHPACFVCTRCRAPLAGTFFRGPDGSPCDFDCYQTWLKRAQ